MQLVLLSNNHAVHIFKKIFYTLKNQMGDVQDGTTIEGNADWKGESIRDNISSFELLKLF